MYVSDILLDFNFVRFGRSLNLVAHKIMPRHEPAVRRPHACHQRGGRVPLFDLNAVLCKTLWRPSLQFHDGLMQSALVSQKETNKP